MMISLAETIVSLTELTAGATMMTVWDSSMAVDGSEIIVNETELIAFGLKFCLRFNESRRKRCLKSVPFPGNVPFVRQICLTMLTCDCGKNYHPAEY